MALISELQKQNQPQPPPTDFVSPRAGANLKPMFFSAAGGGASSANLKATEECSETESDDPFAEVFNHTLQTENKPIEMFSSLNQ